MLVKMPELQVDVAVANRFISSLSKSLQALCHGCMDFDSGIEIVGYINVNIDCGSKVDYVLNEKVLKSTTNSMTFVSNSFLAKKEQPKHMRDGMCSPVLELNRQPQAVSPYQSQTSGYLQGLNSRSPGHSSQSFRFRGSQKRSWGGVERDWRISPKKQRDGKLPYPSSHEQSFTTPLSSTSSHSPADPSFKWPETSGLSSESTNADGHQEINIKKELLESDSDKTKTESELERSHATDQDAYDASHKSGGANIKTDPDATSAMDNDSAAHSGSINGLEIDFKDTFLEPSASESQGVTEQNRSDKDTNDNQQTTAGSSQHSDSHNVSTDDADELSTAPEADPEHVGTVSEEPAECDEAGEEGAYPHSVYSDAGEGLNDDSQFEVIEIDDEDEDVQAMFGKTQSSKSRGQNKTYPHRFSFSSNSPYSDRITAPASGYEPGQSYDDRRHQLPMILKPLQCPQCQVELSDEAGLKAHMSECHNQLMPFSCSQCGRGYQTYTGLMHHVQAHKGKTFMCPVCDTKFTQKFTIKKHLRAIHSSAQCISCQSVFKIGDDFNRHVINCRATN